jgi:hypothetical protein
MHKHVTPVLTEQILDAGHNLDYVDAESVLALGLKHPVLVMPHVSRLAPAVLAKLAAYVRGGGKIIAVGSTPSLAPGLDAARISATRACGVQGLLLAAGVQRGGRRRGVGAPWRGAAPRPEAARTHPTSASCAASWRMPISTSSPTRATSEVAPPPASVAARARGLARPGQRQADARAARQPELVLAPYESRVLVLSDAPLAAVPAPRRQAPAVLADLGRGLEAGFPAAHRAPSCTTSAAVVDRQTRRPATSRASPSTRRTSS